MTYQVSYLAAFDLACVAPATRVLRRGLR